MTTKSLTTLAVLILGMSALTASAAVIFDDNFTGSAGSLLNSSYWVDNENNTLNGDGTATIGGDGTLTGSVSVAPTATDFVRSTVYISAARWNNGNMGFGNGTDSIVIRDDTGTNTWWVSLNGQAGYGTWGFDTGADRQWNWSGDPPGSNPTASTIQVDWYTNKVLVAFNGSPIFNSSVNTPLWTVSTAAQHMNVTSGYGSFIIDRATLETGAVPEPATLALLGLGGLAVVLRRKRV